MTELDKITVHPGGIITEREERAPGGMWVHVYLSTRGGRDVSHLASREAEQWAAETGRASFGPVTYGGSWNGQAKWTRWSACYTFRDK